MARIAAPTVARAKVAPRPAQDVHHAPQGAAADRHSDGTAGIVGLHPAHDALGGLHRNATHAAFPQVLLHFSDDVERLGDIEALAGDAHRVIDLRQLVFLEADIDDRPDYLHHPAEAGVLLGHCSLLSGASLLRSDS